jgi:alkylhydroperoxidase family enzyme
MLEPDPPARLPPLSQAECSDRSRAFLSRWTGGIFKDADSNPVLLTLARHPPLAEAFSQFNVYLLSASTLPVRQRQIAILRTAWVCGSRYMWSSHLSTSLRCGLEAELFGAIQAGADDAHFTAFERTILLATDELVSQKNLGALQWQALMAEWSPQQMLDYLFTVGCYVAMAGVMGAIGVERGPDLLQLAARYGAPCP